MDKKLVMGTVFGGLAVFVWGMLSWMVLPWHQPTMQAFTDETTVAAVVRATAPKAGVYVLPNPADHPSSAGPWMFAAIRPNGVDPKAPSLYLRGLLVDMVGAFLMTWLLLSLPELTFAGRVRVVTLAALIGGALGHLPNWQWWGFSTGYTLVAIVDVVAAYFLAGLVIARVVGDQSG